MVNFSRSKSDPSFFSRVGSTFPGSAPLLLTLVTKIRIQVREQINSDPKELNNMHNFRIDFYGKISVFGSALKKKTWDRMNLYIFLANEI